MIDDKMRSSTRMDGAPAGRSSRGSNVLTQFAADRAHDAAEALYARAKARIDGVHQSAASRLSLEAVLERGVPLARRTARFVRAYPWRSGAIVALLAGAAALARTPTTAGSKGEVR
ncbi:MAG: hypothetical protein ACT4P0_04205 [Panacagrimonas sp.]